MIGSQEQRIDYFMVLDGPSIGTPQLYRLPGADNMGIEVAAQQAGFEVLSDYHIMQEGQRKIRVKAQWRRQEGQLSGKPAFLFGGAIHSYYFPDADYERANQALTEVGFVKLEKLSDLD